MAPTDTQLMPNLIYLLLMAGVWLAAMALASPGTGLLELAAFALLVLAGIGTLRLPVDLWALLVIALGAAAFGGALRARRAQLWLVLSALLLSAGSAFLFGMQAWRPTVHPLLAATVSVLTVGFFRFAVGRGILSQRGRPQHDLGAVVGQVGEVRTPLDPVGSVYVGGELWSARSEAPVAAGAAVRVRGREGLVLIVEPVRDGPAATP
jgi:membrane-bound serine protease (ClpP class)